MKANPKLNLGAWLDKDAFVAWYNETNNANIKVEDLKSVKLDREGNAGYIKPAIEESLLRTVESKHYLYPIPTQEIALYQSNGYTLSQNPGW